MAGLGLCALCGAGHQSHLWTLHPRPADDGERHTDEGSWEDLSETTFSSGIPSKWRLERGGKIRPYKLHSLIVRHLISCYEPMRQFIMFN